MSDEFDQLATLPGAFVQVATTGHCLNEYMVVGPGVAIGDHIPCDAGCGGYHEVRDVLGIELVPTIEIPGRDPRARQDGGTELTDPAGADVAAPDAPADPDGWGMPGWMRQQAAAAAAAHAAGTLPAGPVDDPERLAERIAALRATQPDPAASQDGTPATSRD
jgi:hypothetical protein